MRRRTAITLLVGKALAGCATRREDAPRRPVQNNQTTLSAASYATDAGDWREPEARQETERSRARYTGFSGLTGAIPGISASPAGQEAPEPAEPAGEENPPTATPDAPGRLMVYTARIQLLVASVEEARDRFVKDVESRGGYLQRRRGDLLICRVPARDFEAVLEAVRGLGKVLDESLQALDVTKEYRDLEIQLDNAKKSRERLLALLEKATQVEDLLKIETELRRLTGEIERLAGELKYLGDRIALSTIEVDFRSNAPPTDPSERVYSRFWWINRLGVDNVLDQF